MAGMLSFSMLFTANGFMPMNVTEVQAEEVASLTPDTKWFTGQAQEYTLTTAEELLGLQTLVTNENNYFEGITIRLGADIDMQGIQWTPINQFNGNFDGDGHSISNFYMSTTIANRMVRTGFFVRCKGTEENPVEIKNLTMKNVHSVVNTSFSGSTNTSSGNAIIVGMGNNINIDNCKIENCSVVLNATGTSQIWGCAAGLIGRMYGGTISNCEVTETTVKAENTRIAGLICGCVGRKGDANDGNLKNVVENVVAEGKVTAYANVGGIVGYFEDIAHGIESKIENAFVNQGSIISATEVAGGITGYNSVYINNSVNYGSVSSESEAAGIACMYTQAVSDMPGVENCLNFGTVSGGSYAGGILTKTGTYVTFTSAKINNCANLGSVIAAESGGVADVLASNGNDFTTAISNSYSIGQATGSDETISAPNQANTYTNVYIQAEDAGKTEGVYAMTAEQFKDRTVVDALNENDNVEDIVWYQNEEYPDLAYNMTLTASIEVPQSLEVTVGEETDAKASVTPEDATVKTLLYSSSDETVAVVSEEGVITGVKAGTAEITVTTLDTGRNVRIAVTVKEAAQPQKPSTPADNAGTTPTQPSTPSQSPAGQDTTPARGQQVRVGTNTYVITDTASKAVEFSGTAKKKVAKVTIPASVKIGNTVYKVTSIEKNAFKNNKKLKTVVIGKNVKSIGKKAFFGCKNLRKITVKSKVLTKVGAKAFKGIDKKAVIKVPAKKYNAYRKLLRGKGQAGTVTIKK